MTTILATVEQHRTTVGTPYWIACRLASALGADTWEPKLDVPAYPGDHRNAWRAQLRRIADGLTLRIIYRAPEAHTEITCIEPTGMYGIKSYLLAQWRTAFNPLRLLDQKGAEKVAKRVTKSVIEPFSSLYPTMLERITEIETARMQAVSTYHEITKVLGTEPLDRHIDSLLSGNDAEVWLDEDEMPGVRKLTVRLDAAGAYGRITVSFRNTVHLVRYARLLARGGDSNATDPDVDRIVLPTGGPG